MRKTNTRAHAHTQTHVLTHTHYTAQAGAPVPPLATHLATHGEDGRRRLKALSLM